MNIRDIAELAGVGVSTVSRVLNNHPDVKITTRERVLRIIEEYKYIPNNSARVLKKNNTNNIGILVRGVFNPFFSEMINIIGGILENEGYTMILEQNDFNFHQDVDNIVSFVKEKKLQGVICLGGNFIDIKEDSFVTLQIPVVLTSVNTVSKLGKDTYSSIGIDNEKAAFEATKYLIENGHRKIVLILGKDDDMGATWWRLNGYKNALYKYGIDVDENLILVGNYDVRRAYEVTKKILKEEPSITAIFALSDIMAIGCAKAITESNNIIGRDISLIGFDGMDYSEFYTPGITTVKQPRRDMAKKSAELLIDLMKGKIKNKHIILESELVKRESCSNINRNEV